MFGILYKLSVEDHDYTGLSPRGKASDFDSDIRRFKSCQPSHIFSWLDTDTYGPLAQSAEHMTFNHGVRSSNLRWLTKQKKNPYRILFLFIYELCGDSNSERAVAVKKIVLWTVF